VKNRNKADRKGNSGQRQIGRTSLRNKVLIAVAVIATLAVIWFLKGNRDAQQQTPLPTASQVELQKLKGRWVRADGGYVLDIKQVDEGGRMDASYFNPRPINVAKAEALRKGSVVKVFVELRDTNYPGSTYDLTYDESRDELRGNYFQAALGQTFDVVFQRMK
jgi:hypothetical protein